MLNFKGVSSVNTSFSLKYNKTLKALPLRLYESIQTALGEGLVTNIALMCYICHLTSHLELYIFIQTGGSALSNT